MKDEQSSEIEQQIGYEFENRLLLQQAFTRKSYTDETHDGDNNEVLEFKRTTRYGNSELSFYEKYESELGSWRTIKMNGGYFPFEKLKEILSRQGKYVCTTDAR